MEVPGLSVRVEGQRRRRRNWVRAAEELPGVSEGDMPIENHQRKHGTTRGLRRRTSPAKAFRINRRAAKSGGAREWGG
jgi:hypothetical protein